jgi:hypothetical protein
LADKPSGITTDASIDAVRAIGGPDVPRNSMTPQLSRLKAQGFLALEGGRWKLAEFKTGAAFNPTNTSDAEDLIG